MCIAYNCKFYYFLNVLMFTLVQLQRFCLVSLSIIEYQINRSTIICNSSHSSSTPASRTLPRSSTTPAPRSGSANTRTPGSRRTPFNTTGSITTPVDSSYVILGKCRPRQVSRICFKLLSSFHAGSIHAERHSGGCGQQW